MSEFSIDNRSMLGYSILQLLRPPASADLRRPLVAQWDWRPFASACDNHQVSPVVFCRLRDLPAAVVPSELLEHLRARFYEISARNYHLARKLVDLTSLLEAHHIPVLAYKGPAVAMAVYGDLALRQYEDLDLVVRAEHLLVAVDLLTRCGFEIAQYSPRPKGPRNLARHHEVTLQAPDKTYFVDLHWQLAPNHARAFSLDVDKVWDRAVREDLPHGNVSTLCREDLFLALCCHGTVHRWSLLKWLLDVAEILGQPQRLNWARIKEMTAGWPSAIASASLAVLLARDLLGVPIPTEAESSLPTTQRTRDVAVAIRQEILLRGRTSGNNHTALLGLDGGLLAWLKYLSIQYPAWFFHHAIVRICPKDHAVVRLPDKLRFLYHLIRPARLAVKYGRRAGSALWSFIVAHTFFEQRRASTTDTSARS
jgi:hypothetical protein